MNRRVVLVLAGTATVAAASLFLSWFVSAPPLSLEGLLALLLFLGLAVVSNGLGITVDEEGTRTSFDFITHLAAIPLIGPFGAGIVGGVGASLYQAVATDKPAVKWAYNGVQFALAASAAGLVYVALGGEPSLTSMEYSAAFVPFLAAAVTESVVNTLAVTGIVSASRGVSITHTWRELKGILVIFDLVFSLLGFAIAAIYVTWGPVALIVAVVPLFGLRYFYGINIELRNLSKDLTRVLVRTIEAQDPYTSGHSLRVSEYASRIAEKMGLGYGRIHQIETAALLHDIGKIDRAYRTILTQEGPLTDQQRELIHAHPERGAELLEPVRSLDETVMEMIRHHHERYDGDGYPDGLEGEEIPLGARIIMVADTVDAMMTTRSYRDSLDPEDVRRELRMLREEQFDPDVVDAALEIGIVRDAAEAEDRPDRTGPDEAVERPT